MSIGSSLAFHPAACYAVLHLELIGDGAAAGDGGGEPNCATGDTSASKGNKKKYNMSLLREIQDAAIDSTVSLATLLRKCKVLAARLGSQEFKTWIENELSGYKETDNLPDYRVFRVHSKGHFSGPFKSELRDVNIPLSCIDKRLREDLSYTYLTQPIASLETLFNESKDSGSGTLSEPWDPDVVAYVGEGIYEGMNCLQAWKVIPTSRIVAALDAVRNRILNFVLEIEAESPDAGEAPINSNPVPQEKVQHIFNTYITGNVQNVATGSTHFKQEAVSRTENDKLFAQLLDALRNSQEDKKIIAEFTEVVEEMRSTHGTSSFKTHYNHFMSVLSDHITVFTPILSPFLPALERML